MDEANFAEELAKMVRDGIVGKDQAMGLWDKFRKNFGMLTPKHGPAQNASYLPMTGPTTPKPVVGPRQLSEQDAYRVLMLRLRVQEGMTHTFKHLGICQDKDKTYVFVVSTGGATILEDDPNLFPSDALIAQLILLRG